MAGFRMGRGRDSRDGQQQAPQHRPGQSPYGQPYGAPPAPPYAGQHQQWQHSGHGGQDEGPEYFGGHAPHQGQGQGGPGRPHGHDPYANNPGHTQAFTVGDLPGGYGQDGGHDPYGGHPAPPAGPRLHWKQLLSGIVLRPNATFWQMRDYPVWGPALLVTFVYGMLAVFGFAEAREEVLSATLSNSIPWVISGGLAIVISGLILGAVTHTLARQLGGNGSWQPTVGLSMLITAITDAPRLVLAMFMSGDNTVVQVVGWLTWLAAGALLASMVSKSHDLPWPKALGASAIQLAALLALLKLGTF
ncbi:Yip1 family protein [Streptomyces zingiberis]|uniref:YIP1 family protein n=1 Tax=Streptomyces zingiberis TaxID=2053010 RepID=A0ABX1BNQ9_9ACTN|nr:Yip1 family protein [Streptomyces zingiberis]NJP99368.1 YIP1 family protein [Streptomyces zingiberis]